MSETKMMYVLKESLNPPNGGIIRIYAPSTGGNFIPFTDLKQPLGYKLSTNLHHETVAKKALSESNVNIVLGAIPVSPHRVYFIKLSDTPSFLKKFIELENLIGDWGNAKEKAFAAQELLKWVGNLPYFSEEPKEDSDSDIKEELTMNDTVTTLTVSDIEDIKTRAEALKEAFDVSKKDALRAVVQLKSEEINRNLLPLIELLKSN